MKLKNLLPEIVFLIFTTSAYFLVLHRAMTSGYNHDENQFIASAYLLASDVVLPYVDYPYFHMPNLVFIYAVLFRFTTYKLLVARYFSTLSAMSILSMMYWVTFYLYKKQSLGLRLLTALCAGFLLLANPLFASSAGRAWNHDLSILLALMATITFIIGFWKDNVRGWLFFSGVLLSLAIGVRGIWGIVIPVFLLGIFIFQKSATLREQFSVLLWFALGGFLAMLPTIILFIMAPKKFLFGNLGYARLNALYRQQTGYDQAMTLSAKIKYFVGHQEPGFLLFLFMIVVVIYVLGIFRFRQQKKIDPIMLFVMILILFIFLGALLPTPSFRQYFYALVPFSVLAMMYQVAEIVRESTRSIYQSLIVNLVVLVTVFSGIYGLKDYPDSWHIDRSATWFPLHAHWIGEYIAAKVDSGKVLTLAPLFVAEASRKIYPEFATGPFAWRTAELLPENQRVAFDMVAADNLNDFLRQQQPAGILVGWESDLEYPILMYAQNHEYQAEKVYQKFDIWLP